MTPTKLRMKSAALTCAALLALAGCSTTTPEPTLPFRWDSATTVQVLRVPRVGEVATVEIGATMISASQMATTPAILLRRDYRHVRAYSPKLRMALDLKAGLLPMIASDDQGGRYFDAPGGLPVLYEDTAAGRFAEEHSTVSGGVHVAIDGRASVFWVWPGKTRVSISQDGALSALLDTDAKSQTVTPSGFRRELVYSGRSASTITLVYREFSGDFARPAFTQELRYDLSAGPVIGYKGARFEVLDATNTTVTYRTVAPLE